MSTQASWDLHESPPLISIVIPTYNNAEYLADTINSVLKQTYSNIEIIVVDDGSTDRSPDVLRTFGEKISVIKSENLGAAHARNLGIKASYGEILAFLDSDDLWEPSKIEKQVLKMAAEGLDLVYCSGKEFGNLQKNLTRHQARFSGDCYKYFVSNPTTAIIVLGCSSALIKKEVLDKSGLFDEKFRGPAEDWDFFRRICRNAKVGFISEELVKYRIHGKNISRASAAEYFSGNKMAVENMIFDDKSIDKRLVWTKFHLAFIKSSIKSRDFTLLIKVLNSFFRKQITR